MQLLFDLMFSFAMIANNLHQLARVTAGLGMFDLPYLWNTLELSLGGIRRLNRE